MVIIKDLHIFDTNQTKLILYIAQLEIERGSCCLIEGNSGTGKTMLLKTLANQHHSFAGNILINERIYESFDNTELVKLIQFLNQTYTLFSHLSALEQLMQPLMLLKKNTKKEASEKINFYVDYLGLKDHLNKLPSQLSGGQRQRFALIQKILLEPELLLLDEPTSGLDTKNKELVLRLLKTEQNRNNLTIIMTSHDRDVAESDCVTQKFLVS